ncbi:MAG: DinB family protein [Blastocatellia bacterium]
MNHPQTLIAALAGAPEIIIGLVREVPPQNLKRRPSPDKWSAHEHACHITTIDAPYLVRLELMLADPAPRITPMSATPEESAGALFDVDLDEALASYVRDRARLVERLQQLSEADWQRTAEHPEFIHYSVWIMFRQLLLHEMQHAYRIEELRLKKDWR